MTPAAVCRVLVDRRRTVLDAREVVVVSLEDRDPVVVAASHAGDATWLGGVRVGDPVPPVVADVLRSGRPAFGAVHPDHPGTQLATLPLTRHGRRAGAIAWEIDGALPLDTGTRAYLRDAAMHAELALERARSAERVRIAQAEAQAARRRLDVLVAAGQILGASLDPDETLAGLARAAIPDMGDYCIVDVLAPEGVRRYVAAAGRGQEAVARSLRERPVDPEGPSPVAEVLRTGHSQVLHLDDALRDRVARDETHRRVLDEMGAHHALLIPLQLRGHVQGCMTFVSLDRDRPFGPGDVALAEVLAQRAAKAIENTRLHGELRDLAAHERVRAAEMRSLLAAIGEGIVRVDADGRVHSQNGAAQRMLGSPVATADELWARLGVPPDARPSITAALAPAEYPLGSPARRWLEVAGYPLLTPTEDGRGPRPGSVLVLRDVTAFRQGQALREAFVGLLSHEVRTPVTSIYAGAMVLGKRGDRLDPATRQEILGDIVAEADRLFRLTEDLLVLARFDEGLELVHEPSLLQRLVPMVVGSEQQRWPQARFEVRAEVGLPAVTGDDTSIQQIVRNLLSNAAKYAPSGEPIEVLVEGDGAGVAVRVQDRGPGLGGVPAQDLFTPFYRAPATAATAAGAGIGLFVCQRLIEAMGGRIWGRDRGAIGGESIGSEFGFWLPAYALDPDDVDDDGGDDPDVAIATDPSRPDRGPSPR